MYIPFSSMVNLQFLVQYPVDRLSDLAESSLTLFLLIFVSQFFYLFVLLCSLFLSVQLRATVTILYFFLM